MEEKVCLSFFLLCAILSQGIFAKSLEQDVGESSELLDRQKRVIDRVPGREEPVVNGQYPFVASLKQNRFMHCVVTILSRHTAITAAACFTYRDLSIYTVHSGSTYSFRGNEHNITERKLHGHSPPRVSSFMTGIALINVNPPFVFTTITDSIGLHSGPVLAGMEGIIAGWGFRDGTGPIESKYIKRLRVITVPIMNHRECQNIYRGHFPISDEDICTYDPHKLCGDTDMGAPLIIDNKLVGVRVGDIIIRGPIRPDVFVLLQQLNYSSWIARNIVE